MKTKRTELAASFIAAVLAVSASASALASCGESSDGVTPASNNPETAAADEIVTEGETTESFDPGLPEMDYGGANFTILTKGVSAYNEWGEVSIWTESENGEVLNDAIYDRNRDIEEAYNIKIVEYQSGSPANDTKKSVSAGDNAYQIVMPAFGDSGSLASNGFLVDLFGVNYVDLSKKWWDQRSISDLTIGGHLFFVGSDISNLNNDATWCTMFNKSMITDFNDPSPYDLVAENKWTFDNYYASYQNIYQDLDGDGKAGAYDCYANLTQNENYNAYYLGTGERLIAKDADDLPVIALGVSEKSANIIESLNRIMNDTFFSLNYHNYGSLGYHLWTTQMFEESRGLFWITNLQIVIRLRDLETPFGIVPVPKYSESQEHYSNVVWTVGSYVAVPKSSDDMERTGIILEAMAAKSTEVLRPAYFDRALTGKYLRDEESNEQLDIIVGERIYDLGLAFDFGGISGVLQSIMAKNSNDIASAMAKKEGNIQKAIDKVVTAFDENT
ncbi:MAG: hypothetical protein K6D94_02120 [Clostridiales bacterium]|nr:hypothetical protein [Clostridiales bacterium]